MTDQSNPDDAQRSSPIDALEAIFGDRLERDASLAGYSTYRVGGAAAALIRVDSNEDLLAIAEVVKTEDLPVLVIGNGSNLVVSDSGFPGLVVHLGDGFAAITYDETSRTLVAGGAALLPVVARRATAAGLTGFEWAVGVPGSVGGAVRMNAGGHGSNIAASLIHATVLDLQTGALGNVAMDDLDLAYRRSNVGPTQLVLEATFQLERGDRQVGEQQLSEIVRWRREHQPGGANGGSVFANPDEHSAGALIDAAGCKGLRIGTAEVSEKHANFIMSSPDGSADDVFKLIVEVQHRVLQHVGIVLRPENRLIGFDLSQLVSVGVEDG